MNRAHLDEFTALAESYQTAKADTPEVLKAADIFFFVADFTLNQGAFHKVCFACAAENNDSFNSSAAAESIAVLLQIRVQSVCVEPPLPPSLPPSA